MRFDLDLSDFDRMRALLDDLPPLAQQRVITPSLRAGARVMADAVKGNTRKGPTGNLRKAAGLIRQSRDFSILGVAFRIGYRAILGAHAILVDQGTGPRQTKSGASRGVMPAFPFFDAAITSASQTVITMIKANWSARLAVEAKRLFAGQLNARGAILPQFRRSRR